MNLKILSKRISTNEECIFYKQIINENSKEADKVYYIKYRDNIKEINDLILSYTYK
jgi:hypothetical protein